MTLLKDEDREFLIEEFGKLDRPVKLVMFTQEFECQYCAETRQISEEVAGLSDKVSLEVYDFIEDEALADQYGVDKIPALIVMEEEKDYGIRYYGIPAGYEFSSLVEDIKMIGSGQSGLAAETKKWLDGLDKPLHLQVFVTPTCPYCPQAVRLAHQLAMESDLVQGDMVEAIEFPHLSTKYQVQGVPRTVINEDTHVEGAAPEQMLLEKLREAINQ